MPGLPDLHRHLDGSLRARTLEQLAGPLPDDLFFRPGMGLQAALACFRFTLSALDTLDAIERVAAEIVQDAEKDGVTTLEVRFGPQLHGPPVPDVVDAALAGLDGRAGLLLCGLYGEDPAVLAGHVELARTRPGVVGIDLAGGPSPTQRFALSDYREPFQAAAEAGLGRTVHAGEGRAPAEIRTAIEVLGAQRIGHGTTLLDDEDVLALVLERGIVIEACPTSNVHTDVIARVGEHPLPRWLELGVRACVCTDNTLLSQVTSSQEHQRAAGIPGMSADLLDLAIAYGHQGAFRR